jgi:hypothetical protein
MSGYAATDVVPNTEITLEVSTDMRNMRGQVPAAMGMGMDMIAAQKRN